jgi:hypothetical protein
MLPLQGFGEPTLVQHPFLSPDTGALKQQRLSALTQQPIYLLRARS